MSSYDVLRSGTPTDTNSVHSRSESDASQQEGISQAIRRAMVLQEKMRKAISRTSPVHCSADRSLSSLNREREALLLVRDHLEVLENKLREIRCLESRDLGDKDGCMYDLDTYRRNLLEAGTKVLTTASTAAGSKNLISEVLQFVDGSTNPMADVSPLQERNENIRPVLSPVSLADLAMTPCDTAFMNKHIPSPIRGVLGDTRSYLTVPPLHVYSDDTSHGGKIHVRDFSTENPWGGTRSKGSIEMYNQDSVSDWYEDIRTSCAASRAASRAPSVHDDVRSQRSHSRKSCAHCGSDHGYHQPKFRPLLWLGRAAVATGLIMAVGQTEIVQQQTRKRFKKAHLGTEMDTGGRTHIPSGLEIHTAHKMLAVWQPPDAKAR